MIIDTKEGHLIIRASGHDTQFFLKGDPHRQSNDTETDGVVILTVNGKLVAVWEKDGKIHTRHFGEKEPEP